MLAVFASIYSIRTANKQYALAIKQLELHEKKNGQS